MGLFNKRKLYAMGMGNSLDKKGKFSSEFKAIQFYDYDKNCLPKDIFEQILEIFPYDCMVFKTLNGFSFISLSVLDSWKIAKDNAVMLSERFGEDYTSGMKELVIRVSAKFRRKDHKKMSHRPFFLGFIQPLKERKIISLNHLNFLDNAGIIPKWVYQHYSTGYRYSLKKYEISIFRYYTKYKKWWRNL
jgi:hypothetical protein